MGLDQMKMSLTYPMVCKCCRSSFIDKHFSAEYCDYFIINYSKAGLKQPLK